MSARILDALDSYADQSGVNWSSLKHILRSPLHYQHARTVGVKETAAMRFGTAVHLAILEPEQFRVRYAVEPEFGDCRSSKNRDARDQWRAEHQHIATMEQDDWDRIGACASAVHAHRPAMNLLRGAEVEQGLTWVDRETGVPCKGRLDAINGTSVIDLKTTTSAEPWAFQSRAAKLLYHAQLAFYCDGLTEVTGAASGAYFIAAESDAPHDVAVYELGDDALAAGRDLYRRALVRLVECEASGTWPGVAGDSILPFWLPKWAQLEQDDLADLGLEM